MPVCRHRCSAATLFLLTSLPWATWITLCWQWEHTWQRRACGQQDASPHSKWPALPGYSLFSQQPTKASCAEFPLKVLSDKTASVVLQQFTSDTVTVQNVLLKAQGHCLFKIPALLNQKSCFYGKNYLVMVTAYFMQVRLVWADCTLWLESPFNFFLKAFASQVPFCS